MFKNRAKPIEDRDEDLDFETLKIINGYGANQKITLTFSLGWGGLTDDNVYYLIPKDKWHNLNFVAKDDYNYRDPVSVTPKSNIAVHILDAEGTLRIERKNVRGTSFTEADTAYEYKPVRSLHPTMPSQDVKQPLGWVSVDITKINFEDYGLIRKALGTTKVSFRDGILKTVLSATENPDITFRQIRKPIRYIRVDEEDELDEEDTETLCGYRYLLRSINVIRDGDSYHVLNRKETVEFLAENIKNVENDIVRVIATVETDGSFKGRCCLSVGLLCKDVTDVRALVGDGLRVIEVESLEDLNEKHFDEFKNHPAVVDSVVAKKEKRWLGLGSQKATWPLLIHITDSGTGLLIRPSVSDIEKLTHTVKILKG